MEKTPQDTYLIEFKNQEEGTIDKKWLKNKIYDSVSTLVMNENITRSDVAGKTTVDREDFEKYFISELFE